MRIIVAVLTFFSFIFPPFVSNILIFLYRLIRYGVRYYSTVGKIVKNNSKLVVVGNGPSLNETFKKYPSFYKEMDCVCVNCFVETSYFSLIKPKLYLLGDPVFFKPFKELSQRHFKIVESVSEKLVNNVNWKMSLIVPSYARKSEFIKKISKNANINTFYYFPYQLLPVKNKMIKFILWNKQLYGPDMATVLNGCVNLGIYLKYQEIYLIGADSTWIEDLGVDQETNNVFLYDKHFYNNEKLFLYSDVDSSKTVTLSEELKSQINVFENYLLLNDYALFNDIRVYNASEYSLIDAFERKKI